MNDLNPLTENAVSRRALLVGAGALGIGTAAASLLSGCGSSKSTIPFATPTPTPSSAPLGDADVLNFALNLEYLEAEYYLRAVTGQGLSAADAGPGAGAVTGGRAVNFTTPAIRAYAQEIANDELLHVRFLRSALGSAAVSRPAIDLTNSFNAAASAAGIGSSFDPFADENSFLVGAFTFEDVGVTAYHGGAGLLQNLAYLSAAAGIMGTEAYHAGEIRTILATLGDPYLTYANKISALRAAAGGGKETPVSGTTIVAADGNSIAYARTPSEVLRIVYLKASGAATNGGFFPNGLNGRISAA